MSERSEILAESLETIRSSIRGMIPSLVSVSMLPLGSHQFLKAPASAHRHHAYDGGLLVHTSEVLKYALAAGQPLAEAGLCDPGILVVSAIWHDYGKIWDYVPNPKFGSPNEKPYLYTDHQKLIHHLPRSYAEFMYAAKNAEVGEALAQRIGHCILAHHGRREWQSPVEPASVEALILHQSDMLSCHYGEGREA